MRGDLLMHDGAESSENDGGRKAAEGRLGVWFTSCRSDRRTFIIFKACWSCLMSSG